MGDSATMGFFSEYENTFSGKITKYFEKKNVDVINGGVISYSPIIYFTKIKYLLFIRLNIIEWGIPLFLVREKETLLN
jgi:hypothetical protein